MKTILLISHSSNNTGGGEEDFLKLLKYLKGKYNLYLIFPFGDNSNMYKSFSDNYLEIKSRIFPFSKFALKEYLGFFFRNYKKVFEIYNFLRKNRNIDFCYVNSSVCFLEVLPLIFFKIPYIVSVKEKINPRFVRKMIYRLYNNTAKEFVAISEYIRSEILMICKNAKISIVYSTIDEKYFLSEIPKIPKKESYLNDNLFTVLNIGSIHQLKGQHVIINAIPKIKLQFPVKLKIIGKIIDEDYYCSLKKMIENFGISGQVEFLGEINKKDIIKEIINSNCISITSKEEGQSLVILESLYLEKPIITTRVGIVPEIIQNRINGLIYNYGDFDELADKIIELKMNNELYKAVISKCKITYMNKFEGDKSTRSIEVIMKKYI